MPHKSLAQSSVEYLIIVAITLAIFVPAAYVFYNYSKESKEELSDAQVIQIGRNIVDTSQSIFYSGQGSKTVLELNMPENVASAVIIDGRELVFNITTNVGVSELVFFSNANITATNCNLNVCNLPDLASSGLKKVKIEAITQDSINISTI